MNTLLTMNGKVYRGYRAVYGYNRQSTLYAIHRCKLY